MSSDMVPRFSLGDVAAFLLPGAVAFRALAYHAPGLRSAWENLVLGEHVAGPSVVAGVTALACGMAISSVRTLLDLVAGERPDYSRLGRHNHDQFQSVIEQKYRFAQFATNMAIATWLLCGCHWIAKGGLDRGATFLLVVALLMSGSGIWQMWDTRRSIRQVLTQNAPAPEPERFDVALTIK